MQADLLACAACGLGVAQTRVDWPVYNGGADAGHYSKLAQINRANVHRLTTTWSFDTGEKGNIEDNPLIVDGVLYAFTPAGKVIALDAATGKLKWKFDSGLHSTQPARGVTYWTDGEQPRIFAGVLNFLYCLDARTGELIATFGEAGRIDLRKQLRGDYEAQSVVLTTPGIIYKDLIIVGGRNPETHPAPPGDIRAFDVRSGELRWTFHTIPRPGEPGYETWPPDAWKTGGAANNWAGMALDAAHGIVYVPTGSAVFDFYGGDRVGNDLYATHCSLLMPIPGRSSGTSRLCITIFGTATCRRNPRSTISSKTARPSKGSRKSPSKAIFISSTGSLDSLFFLSANFLTPQALFPARSPLQPSPSPTRPRPLPASV